MLKALMINVESTDWCGISDTFIYYTDLEDEDMARDAALEEFEDTMRDHLYSEYYESDEDSDDYISQENAIFEFPATWYTEEVYGDLDSPTYHKLN